MHTSSLISFWTSGSFISIASDSGEGGVALALAMAAGRFATHARTAGISGTIKIILYALLLPYNSPCRHIGIKLEGLLTV